MRETEREGRERRERAIEILKEGFLKDTYGLHFFSEHIPVSL